MKGRKERFHININDVNKIVFFFLFLTTSLRIFLILTKTIIVFLRKILIKLIIIRVEFIKNGKINFDLLILFYKLRFCEELRAFICELDIYKIYNRNNST